MPNTSQAVTTVKRKQGPSCLTLLPSTSRTPLRRKVHLRQLKAKHSLLQPGQVLRGIPMEVRQQQAAPCLGKLSDRPGQVAELLRGHHRGQEVQHAVEQLNDGTRLLRGQAILPPLSSVVEKPAAKLSANPIFHILNERLTAKVKDTGAAGDQPLHSLRNLRSSQERLS